MELLALLRRQGFVNVYAGIALPNDASVRLHEAIGMSLIGVYERVGFKLGAWRDVAWYGMRLVAPAAGPPAEPIPLAGLVDLSAPD
jgi:phosphinothricin acetyltransferase